MEKRVVITGLGVITPLGNNVETLWNNLVAGRLGIRALEGMEQYNLPVKVAGQIKDFSPAEFGIDAGTARRNDLFCQYALAAAAQAMAQSGLQSQTNIEPERFGVYIGSGIGGIHTFTAENEKLIKEGAQWISPLFIPMMIANIASGNVAIKYNAQGVCLPVVTACATGTHSVGEAYRAIKHGYADAIIAGGAEAAVHPIAIAGFANSKALSRAENPAEASLPFDSRRGGFVISEGAGILILEEYEHAIKRGAPIVAEMCGYGNSCDAYHYTAPRPDGAAAARAISDALKEASFGTKDLLYINSHGTGTPLNDKSETLAIKLAMGEQEAHRAIIDSTKSMTGHMLGATGGVEAVVAALALKEGVIPPTVGLTSPDPECDLDYTPLTARKAAVNVAISNSLGFGGHNSCIAMRKL